MMTETRFIQHTTTLYTNKHVCEDNDKRKTPSTYIVKLTHPFPYPLLYLHTRHYVCGIVYVAFCAFIFIYECSKYRKSGNKKARKTSIQISFALLAKIK